MKTTVVVCITVILCLIVGVGGFLAHHGTFGSQFYSLMTWTGVGIGILANYIKTAHVEQKTEKVEAQTNGQNTRLQKLADHALAALPPTVATDIVTAVDTPDDGTDRSGPDDGGYYPRR